MTTKKTAKICIDCLFRGGSNHLTANLHYQDGFFGHSERKSFGNVARHDVFGNYRADKQFNENKYDTAKYHVWKRFWTRSGNFHYTGKNGKKHGHIVVFLIRHPYMVYKSMLRYIDKATKEDKQPANPWITDGFKNEILSDMIGMYERLFRIIGICKKADKEFHMFFHERYLKEGEPYLAELIKKMNLEDGDALCNNIKSHKDYLDDLNLRKLPEIKDLNPGYGGYEPWRKIDYKNEIDQIRECPEPIIDSIYESVLEQVGALEKSPHADPDAALDLIRSELEEFKEFYTKTIFEL